MRAVAIIAVALVVVVIAAYRFGIANATEQASRHQAEARAHAAATLARATAESRRAERVLQGRIDNLTNTHLQEISHRERSTNDLAARLRTGSVRVSVPVPACDAAEPDRTPDAATATSRAELAPETAIALDRIAADGDAAILDLNACLAAYGAAQAAVAAH